MKAFIITAQKLKKSLMKNFSFCVVYNAILTVTSTI